MRDHKQPPPPRWRPRDPQTPAEWQEAVNLAYFHAAVDAARQYGLIKGGPDVDLDRCEDLLARGTKLGYRPEPDIIERFLK